MARTKPNEQAQIDFIAELLIKGEKRNAILGKFGKKWENVSRTTFDRRLKAATEASQAQQRRIQEKAEGNVAKKVEALESKIMSAIERKDYLTKIITGEIEIPYTEVKWDTVQKKFVTIKFVELAPHTARISAIAELNKMDGEYAPHKTDITSNGKGIKSIIVERVRHNTGK